MSVQAVEQQVLLLCSRERVKKNCVLGELGIMHITSHLNRLVSVREYHEYENIHRAFSQHTSVTRSRVLGTHHNHYPTYSSIRGYTGRYNDVGVLYFSSVWIPIITKSTVKSCLILKSESTGVASNSLHPILVKWNDYVHSYNNLIYGEKHIIQNSHKQKVFLCG